MSRQPTEIMALRHLANELEHLDALKRHEALNSGPRTPAMDWSWFICEQHERIREARQQLKSVQVAV